MLLSKAEAARVLVIDLKITLERLIADRHLERWGVYPQLSRYALWRVIRPRSRVHCRDCRVDFLERAIVFACPRLVQSGSRMAVRQGDDRAVRKEERRRR